MESYRGSSTLSWCIPCLQQWQHVSAPHGGSCLHEAASQGYAVQSEESRHQQTNKPLHGYWAPWEQLVHDPKNKTWFAYLCGTKVLIIVLKYRCDPP